MFALTSSLAWGQAAVEPNPTPLAPQQLALIDLLAYAQVSALNCGFVIDTELLRLAAQQEGVGQDSAVLQKAVENALADAQLKFAGLKRGVECLSALEEYGPNGTRFKGLIQKRPE